MAKRQQTHLNKATYNYQKNKEKWGKTYYEDDSKNYLMIPIYIIIAIIPLIVKLKEYDPKLSQYSWFPDIDFWLDSFLYYKQWFIMITASVMVLFLALKALGDISDIKLPSIFIPLFVYALFAILSTICSKYISYSISGSYEQFESVFVLLGYCVIAYYSYIAVKTEKDLKSFVYVIIIAVLIMSIIGVTQFTGHDIFSTEVFKKFITPGENVADLDPNFEEGRVFLTLYNPNYVGVYAALLIPILMVFALLIRDIKVILLSIIGIIGLIVSVIGSLSLTGFICIIASMCFFVILMRKYLLKRKWITLSAFLILIASLFVMNVLTDRSLEMKLKSMFNINKTVYNITNMETNDDNISITYKGNKLYVQYILNDDKTATILPLDENFVQVEGHFDEASRVIYFTDERFKDIALGFGEVAGRFHLLVDGVQYNFINDQANGTYYYINTYGKFDKMVQAPSAVFTGYEGIASNRGYIWSRTIPLLKDYIFLGSGPDTFTMVYPQNDYLYMANAGFRGAILTKPHSLYLQIAVQTGMVSLIAFLVFYGMYFVSSMKLYLKEKFTSIYSKIGVAIFIGTISYMIAGITNDSSVTTAPLFWVMIGVGISMNHKAKDLLKVDLEKENKAAVKDIT